MPDIDRTQLTEALAYEDGELIDRPNVADTSEVIREAARWVRDFPTDEQVEAAARALASHHGIKPEIWDLPEWKGDRLPWLRDARAALEAVTMIGDTE